MLDQDDPEMTLSEAYRILRVNKSHGLDQIKQSYRRAARLYHPDVSTGLADAEKFQLIVRAYDIISREKKRTQLDDRYNSRFAENQQKKGFIGRFKIFFGGGKKSGNSSAYGDRSAKNNNFYRRRSAGILTFEDLCQRFDASAATWVKIESAHTIFDSYINRFEFFATTRLKRSGSTIRSELLRLLGRLNSQAALCTIAPYLYSREREVMISAFMALDSAGSAGYTLIDRYLNPPSAFAYFLGGFSGSRSELEKLVLRRGLVKPHRLRRLFAMNRRSGVPLQDLLEGIGITVS